MTDLARADVIAQIVALTPLNEHEVAGLLACKPEEVRLLLESYDLAVRMPDKSPWDTVLAILKVTGDFANLIIPINTAIAGIYGLTKG